MNKKLLAAAVASAVAVPGVVAADASFYGSLKPRIQRPRLRTCTLSGRCFAHWLEVQYGHGQWQHSIWQG
ncbi:MAG: hypothetical protein ACJ0US_13290 [Arenicellales bacterium]